MILRQINAHGGKSTLDPSLRKLRNRLLSINIISLTVVVLASMSIVYFSMLRSVQNEIEERLRGIPPGVAENVRLWHGFRDSTISLTQDNTAFAFGGGIIVGGVILVEDAGRFPVDYDKSFVANVLPDGQVTVFSLIEMSDLEYTNAIQTALAMEERRGTYRDFGGGSPPLFINGESWSYRIVTTLQGASDLAEYQTSIVFLNIEEETSRLRALGISLMSICSGWILIILLLGYYFANRAIAPVQASMDRQRRFVADASHELKTPITVIAMNAEAARGSKDNDEITNNLNNIEVETSRMGVLVHDLILLAREEEIKPMPSQFNLIETLEEETRRIETVLFEKGIELVFQKPDVPVSVYTDREKLKAIISILLDNAVKYTKDGGYVKAIVVPGSGKTHARIVIENLGAYIPREDLPHIFDRFYRGDKSRNSSTGGHGMGLAIAKEITKRLGIQLKAESLPLEDGTATNKFTIIL